MSIRPFVITAFVTGSLLSACSSKPRAGGQISPEMKSKIETLVRERINDPDSLKIQWLPLSNNFRMYCFRINAKNGLGGYVGYKPAIVFFTDETQSKISEISLVSRDSDVAFSNEQCAKQGYDTLHEPTT